MSPEQSTGASSTFARTSSRSARSSTRWRPGARAFQRASAPQTLAAIIQDEPDPIAARNPRIPAPLRWTVQRCLAKKAADRYASTEDLVRELATIRDNLSEASAPGGVFPEAAATASNRRRWIVAALAAAVLVLGGVAWRLRQADYFWKNPLAGAVFTRLTDWEGTEFDASISTDGKFVAFISDQAGQFDAWVVPGRQRPAAQPLARLASGDAGQPAAQHRFLRRRRARLVRRVRPSRTGRISDLWIVPTIGGDARLFLPDAVTVAWSRDGSRMVYNTAAIEQVMFVADRSGANRKRILAQRAGDSQPVPRLVSRRALHLFRPRDHQSVRHGHLAHSLRRRGDRASDEPSLARVVLGVSRRPHADLRRRPAGPRDRASMPWTSSGGSHTR